MNSKSYVISNTLTTTSDATSELQLDKYELFTVSVDFGAASAGVVELQRYLNGTWWPWKSYSKATSTVHADDDVASEAMSVRLKVTTNLVGGTAVGRLGR